MSEIARNPEGLSSLLSRVDNGYQSKFLLKNMSSLEFRVLVSSEQTEQKIIEMLRSLNFRKIRFLFSKKNIMIARIIFGQSSDGTKEPEITGQKFRFSGNLRKGLNFH